jgi:hypothetical protein
MKKIIIFAFLFQLLSCIKADVKKALDEYGLTDNSPSASTISATISEDTATLVTLSYTDLEGDIGMACTLSSLLNLTGTCSCTSGTCQANVTGTLNFSGAASFSYTVTANGLVSNAASASITITAATIPLVDGVSSNEHRVFLSSSKSQGNIGGVNAANTICQNLAVAAGLQKTYKALLGEIGKDPLFNISNNGGKLYAFTSGSEKKLVADSLQDFVRNDIVFDAKFDENYIDNTFEYVWTGITRSGVSSWTCNDWTLDDGTNARGGFFYLPECKPLDYSSPGWMEAGRYNNKSQCETNGFNWNDMIGFMSVGSDGGLSCAAEAHIYCISQ